MLVFMSPLPCPVMASRRQNGAGVDFRCGREDGKCLLCVRRHEGWRLLDLMADSIRQVVWVKPLTYYWAHCKNSKRGDVINNEGKHLQETRI